MRGEKYEKPEVQEVTCVSAGLFDDTGECTGCGLCGK